MDNGFSIMQRLVCSGRKALKIAQKACRDRDAVPIDTLILVVLFQKGGDCSHEEMSEATGFHGSTISKTFTRLGKIGITKSYHDLSAPRKKKVIITEKGNELIKKLVVWIKKWEQLICRELSEAEREQLIKYLVEFYNRTGNVKVDTEGRNMDWPLVLQYISHSSMNINAYDEKNDNGLETNERYIILYLLFAGGEASYKDVEKHTVLSQSCVVNTINKLMEKGLVRNEVSELDSRAKRVIMLPEGEKIAGEIADVLRKYEDEACINFTPEERTSFCKLLDKVWDALNEHENIMVG